MRGPVKVLRWSTSAPGAEAAPRRWKTWPLSTAVATRKREFAGTPSAADTRQSTTPSSSDFWRSDAFAGATKLRIIDHDGRTSHVPGSHIESTTRFRSLHGV